MNSITVNLITAKALINSPEKLCRCYYAVDKDNNSVDTLSKDACRFCASGAICKVLEISSESGDYTQSRTWLYLSDASIKLFDRSPASVNDNCTHKDIMKCYDEAIRLSSVE